MHACIYCTRVLPCLHYMPALHVLHSCSSGISRFDRPQIIGVDSGDSKYLAGIKADAEQFQANLSARP